MNNEPNKPIPAQELTEKELESITGGGKVKEIIWNTPAYNINLGLEQYQLGLPGQTDELIQVHTIGEMQS